METTTSADGTTLAFERTGEGQAVIIVPGAMCTRGITAALARELAAACTVLNLDRRARGDSDDRSGPPYAPERETEDLAALIDAAGGHAALYGHSSGAAVVLRAAAAGLPIDRIVLHDAPFNVEPTQESVDYSAELLARLAAGEPGEAVLAFMRQVGVPEPALAGMQAGPQWSGMASAGYSLAYDSAAMGDAAGGAVPTELLAQIRMPTMVLVGAETWPFMIEAGRALHAGIPGSQFELLAGANHEASAELVAPRLVPFLTGSSVTETRGS